MIDIKYKHESCKGQMLTSNSGSYKLIKDYAQLRPLDPFKSMTKDHVITITEIKFWN